MLIYLVWDTSGSMGEWGKLWIARGVARSIEQYLRLGYGSANLKLVAWATEARIVEWNPDDEFPLDMLASEGMSNAKPLIDLFEKNLGGMIVLITDGFWSRPDERALKRWKASLPPDSLRIIKVGADANPHLKGPNVFTAEELFAALDGWLEGGEA